MLLNTLKSNYCAFFRDLCFLLNPENKFIEILYAIPYLHNATASQISSLLLAKAFSSSAFKL